MAEVALELGVAPRSSGRRLRLVQGLKDLAQAVGAGQMESKTAVLEVRA